MFIIDDSFLTSIKFNSCFREMHFKMLEKQCKEDESELSQTLSDHKTFLEKAVHNYCNCLQHGVSIIFGCF